MATAALLSAFAAPAGAHDELEASSPAEDQHLDLPPSAVELEFGGEPMDVGATIVVAGADGRDWSDTDTVVEEGTVRTTLAEPLPDGNYDVRWQIVSQDGDVVSGRFGFGVGDLTDADPVELPAAESAASEPDEESGRVELAGSEAETGSDDGGIPTIALAAIGALAGLVAALAFHRIRGTARSDRPHTDRTDNNQKGPL